MNAGKLYKEIDVHSSGPVGLVLTMYDMLIADLHRAIGALRDGDIERRSSEVKHALDVLQHLQGSLDFKHGGEAANNLDTLYAIVRAKVLQAHMQSSAALMQAQIELIAGVRDAWRELERRENSSTFTESSGAPVNLLSGGSEAACESNWRV
jgi:flagellar protein FliS